MSTGISGELRPQSWVAQSIMRGSVRGTSKTPRRGDARFLTAPRPGSPSQRETLIRSGTAQVDVRLSDADIHGAVARSLSFTSEVEGSQGDFIDDDVHHMDEVVEHLDVIDAHIATVSHLSNAANSILIPPLGMYNRKPIVALPTLSPSESFIDSEKGRGDHDELDRHVEHVLRKRDKLRRSLKGLWAFLKTPIGVITAIYGFLVAFWGAAIVVFLIKIINFHNPYRQKLWIEISSQVENGLFTLTGVGLIPWRAMDIYRIARIWHYKRLSRTLRKKAGLAPLVDENDLPDPMYDPNHIQVLSDKQQAELHDLQQKFMHSQTWYRPHATDTHRAFPINTGLLICSLIGGNSFFQCILCGTMWGLDRYHRPAWSTGILIPASFLCGIFAAVFVWRGGQKTKKTQEVEGRLREALEKRGLIGKDVSQNTDEISSPTKEEGTSISGHENPLEYAATQELSTPSEPVTITTFGGHAGHLP